MHEMKFVIEILKNIEVAKQKFSFERVTRLEVVVGDFSGVNSDSLISSFDLATQNTPYASIELVIVPEPLRVQCQKCHNISEVQDFLFICSYCSSPDTQEIAGKEFKIKSIEGELGCVKI